MSTMTMLAPSLPNYSSASLSSTATDDSIQLLCSIPGTLPRSSPATPQRLTLVAASLSVHLSNTDLPHAFLGRFALFLRGSSVSPRWIDVDISRPIIGGTVRVKDVLALHPDLAIHGEVLDDGVDRLLVSHKCGIYLHISVGAVPHLRKKLNHISAHPSPNSPPVFLPCLTPSRQFLETVIIASGPHAKPEDAQDLIWMEQNLSMELLSDATTLKKTWEEGRLNKVVQSFPQLKEVFVSLGLAVATGDDTIRTTSQSTLTRAKSRYGQ